MSRLGVAAATHNTAAAVAARDNLRRFSSESHFLPNAHFKPSDSNPHTTAHFEV